MAFEGARAAAELQARKIEADSAAIEAVRSGKCAPANALEACRRYDEKLARGEVVTKRLLARWVIDGGFEPEALQPKIEKRPFDGDVAWAELHLPDIAPSIAASALAVTRHKLRREPTPDEVREHAIENAKRTYGDDWQHLVLRSEYGQAERDRWAAQHQALRERRPDLFPGATSNGRPRSRRRRTAA